ncbi:hypothetical protein PG990_003858 [Apiospora arundinis]
MEMHIIQARVYQTEWMDSIMNDMEAPSPKLLSMAMAMVMAAAAILTDS